MKKNQKLATLCLMVAMFLNPMGFDVVQLALVKLTGSLLHANLVMYCLAALFFGFYFIFSHTNPLSVIKDIIHFDHIKSFTLKFKKNSGIEVTIDSDNSNS